MIMIIYLPTIKEIQITNVQNLKVTKSSINCLLTRIKTHLVTTVRSPILIPHCLRVIKRSFNNISARVGYISTPDYTKKFSKFEIA
ncbi:hypothetical protein DERP_009929 [Dermatophagoides pteronyssinus]|uniref:Uncharacterized protein n=1 Tax=Dermatophagoides pteronyssinus TaxID=6956 RepID=A0ABQ8J216_DERPT|nr:hypothetical protein DERP_009929 [Dermatophagoides pteronyssinus]